MTQLPLPGVATRRCLVVDQFSGITPYWLQQEKPTFEALCADVMKAVSEGRHLGFRTPTIEDLPLDYHPNWGETVLAEGEDGRAVIWKCKWDSSG